MTLANGSVTFTGTTVIPGADINGGAIDGVTIGTNSACTQLVVDNVNINGTTIGHTADTDLITLASQSVTIAADSTLTATTVDIDGGAIDGTVIGANSASTAKVTQLGIGKAPVATQSTAGTTNGFVQNTAPASGASTNTVTNESTFTGDLGSTAYTINDIVRALKQFGLLNM